MKKCIHCSANNDDGASLCRNCQTPFPADRATQPLRPARQPTLDEHATRLEPSSPRPAIVVPSPRPPALPVPPAPQASDRRGVTSLMPAPPHPGAAPIVPAAPVLPASRVIKAVLVTWTWSSDGQIFPIRAGRNLIGRGAECDIRVLEDGTLSEVNTHITFRRSFVLGDMVSEGGTELNGEAVEEQFRPLANYAQIRTGSTYWTFVILGPTVP